MKTLLILLLLISSSSYADEWTTEDTVFESIAVSMLIVDWGQTKEIAANPKKYGEANPFLPLHPTQFEVDRYFSTIIISHLIIAKLLPSEIRHIFQSGTIFVEFYATSTNFSGGLTMKF